MSLKILYVQKSRERKIKIGPEMFKINEESTVSRKVKEVLVLYVNPIIYVVTCIGYFILYSAKLV